MKRRIVIITDCSDIAYNELRGVIWKTLDEEKYKEPVEIEPIVQVAPFSIINGNFILRLMADVYPPGTFFLVILNPLKNRSARLFGRTRKNNFVFMGANTGVFDWFARDFGIAELYELFDPGFLPFGGKYVHAPSIAKIIANVSFKKLGRPFAEKDLTTLEIRHGTIVHMDNFGLIKFFGSLDEATEGEKFNIEAGGKNFVAIYAKRMMSYETGEWIIYRGSSLELLELGKVRENGARELELSIGDKIAFRKI